MPAYGSATAVPAIYAGDSYTVWNAETPSTSTASQQVALIPNQDGGLYSISVEIQFSGDPGSFEVDIQDADTDTANAYQNLLGLYAITAVNSAFWARLEVQLKSKFVRLYLASRTNSVTLTAKVSR